MPNPKTEHSRRTRAAAAAQWVKHQVDGGAYRLSALLPAATADKLKAMADRDKASIRAMVIRLIDDAE